MISRLSFHRLARVSRLGTLAVALIVGLALAVPAAQVSAQGLRAIQENGMLVTPAQIGKS